MSSDKNNVTLATADLFQAEIARLQAESERLRSQPCPYVTGNVTRYCTLTPFTLTDEEREAIEVAVEYAEEFNTENAIVSATILRSLLARHRATLAGRR